MAPGLDRKHQKFRRLVTVEFVQAGFQSGQSIGRGFEQQQAFG